MRAYLFFLYFSLVYQLLDLFIGHVRGSGHSSVVLLMVCYGCFRYCCGRHTASYWRQSLVWFCGQRRWWGVGYWLIYGQDFFAECTLFFESNPAEGSEFILSYLRWWYLFVFSLKHYSGIYGASCRR